MRRLQLVVMTFGVCLLSGTSWATRAYVTDSFEITLRTGPSTQNKVIAMPASGEAVEVLESVDEWSHVRFLGREGGTAEGWVLSRYLIDRMPWEMQARTLRAENTQLKEKFAQIESEQRETNQREQELSRELEKNLEEFKTLQSEYDSLKQGATDYLKLKASYEAMKSKLETIQASAQTLSKENERLKNSQRNRWFATGALVLLVGLVIGLVVGRKQKKRKSLYY